MKIVEMEDGIQQRIRSFRKALAGEPTSKIIRKFLTFGDTYILDYNEYYDLKAEIAEHFIIHPSEVLIVGSAKMGFSIAPHKQYRGFNNRSDIDVAIISPFLFDKIWQHAFDYWENSGKWYDSDNFSQYLFRGWIRPDKLPPSNRFEVRKDWWEFFRSISQKKSYGPYKISAGLYKSWHFFEAYQAICVKNCKQDIELADDTKPAK